MSSANGLADWYTPYEVGTGRLDVAAAVSTTVLRHRFGCSSATSTGRMSPSDAPVTKSVTFTNSVPPMWSSTWP